MATFSDKTADARQPDPVGGRPKLSRVVFGVGFLVTGVLGLVLPVLPGTVLIVGGVWILARDLPVFDRIKARIQTRLHPVAERFAAGRAKQPRVSLEPCKGNSTDSDAQGQRISSEGDAHSARRAERGAL